MMKKVAILLILSLALIFPKSGTSQQQYIDSLEAILPAQNDHHQKALMLLNLTKAYRNVNPYAGLDYADSAAALARKYKEIKLLAEIINEKGVSYRKIDMYEQALEQHHKALLIFRDIEDMMGIAYATANIGNVYYDLEQYKRSLDYHMKALKIKKQLNDEKQIAYSFRTTALALQALKKHDLAEEYFREALKIAKKLDDRHSMGNLYYHLGNNAFEANGKKDIALNYFEKALEIYNQLESPYGSAISSYQKAKALLDVRHDQQGLDLMYKAIEAARKGGFRKIIMDAYKTLSDLNKEQGNYQEALRYLGLYADLRKEIFNEKSNRNIAEMQAKYDTQQQLSQIKLLEKERKLTTTNQIIYLLALIFISAFGFLIFKRYRDKKIINIQLQQEIEQRKLQEKKLLKSEKQLKTANATKDKFFSIISHDLKSPFGAILGLSELLYADFENFTKDEQKRIIREIKKATNNTYNLLKDLLAWSQSQRGVIEYSPAIIPVAEICQANLEYTLPAAHNKDIDISCAVPENIFAWADGNMLTTIIRNLLSNAVKFTPRGGNIQIKARELKPKTEENKPGKDMVEISITDSGVGICPENQIKLFKIEEKFKTQGTEKESGTGLGLIICKEFVEKHEGSIRIESEINKGSSFIFTLPAINGKSPEL